MTDQNKRLLRISLFALSYVPISFRFLFFDYDPYWLTFIKAATDAAAISFFWLILSGFPQGVLRHLFPQELAIKFHKYLAPVAFSLVIVHIVGILVKSGRWKVLIPFATQNIYITLGSIATILLLITMVTSLPWIRKRNFQNWNLTHYLNYPFFFLFYIHSLISMPLTSPTGFYHMMLFGIGSAAIAMKFLFDLKLLSTPVRILDIRPVGMNIYNLELDVASVVLRKWRPGQFVEIGISRLGDNHPLSISRLQPSVGKLEVTFKVFGDFTEKLATKKKGDQIFLKGAYGELGKEIPETHDPLVFIAGGVGITPFRAIIHDLLDRNETRKIFLFQACKEQREFVFEDEFKALAEDHQNFSYIQVCQIKPDDMKGKKMETGFVTVPMIQQYIGQFEGKEFFVIGPPVMMHILKDALLKAGVPEKDIQTEEF